MIRGIIEGLLGTYGTALFKIYEQNSLWINGLVVLYGLVIVLSWSNFKRIRHTLLLAVLDQVQKLPEAERSKTAGSLLARIDVPWQTVVAGVRFPLIAAQTAFWPQRLSLPRLQAMVSAEELVKDALALSRQRPRHTTPPA